MREQAKIAIDIADVIIFLTDVKQGVTAADQEIALMLKKSKKPVVLVCNKADNMSKDRNDIYRCTKFLKCPADRIRTTHNGVEYPSQIFTSMAIIHGSYGYNAYLWEQKSSEYAYKLTMIRKNMDKVILFADTSAISNGAIFSGTDIRSGTKKRHPKGYNACYLDGSAKNESENWQSKTTNRINVWNVDAADLTKYMNRN